MRILLTRPVEDATRSAATLRALGHDVMISPVLAIEPLPDAKIGPGPFSALVLTSSNAARALMLHPRCDELIALPVFAVGGQTAEAAKLAGCRDVISADGDGIDLVELIAARYPADGVRLLYLAGRDISVDLASLLSTRDVDVETVTLYRAQAEQRLSEDARSAFAARRIDAVLHYSRRTAAAFVACAQSSNVLAEINAPAHFCISERAAEPLRAVGASKLHIAAHPDETALFALLR